MKLLLSILVIILAASLGFGAAMGTLTEASLLKLLWFVAAAIASFIVYTLNTEKVSYGRSDLAESERIALGGIVFTAFLVIYIFARAVATGGA